MNVTFKDYIAVLLSGRTKFSSSVRSTKCSEMTNCYHGCGKFLYLLHWKTIQRIEFRLSWRKQYNKSVSCFTFWSSAIDAALWIMWQEGFTGQTAWFGGSHRPGHMNETRFSLETTFSLRCYTDAPPFTRLNFSVDKSTMSGVGEKL